MSTLSSLGLDGKLIEQIENLKGKDNLKKMLFVLHHCTPNWMLSREIAQQLGLNNSRSVNNLLRQIRDLGLVESHTAFGWRWSHNFRQEPQARQPSRVLAIFNLSGGVGKTTLGMNLAYHLQQQNQRTLLVDLDPQGSLTEFMGLEPFRIQTTIYHSLLQDQPLPIHKDIYGIDLIPSNIYLAKAEQELVLAEMGEILLKEALSIGLAYYDFILIDCSPSLGLLNYSALLAATHILIPIQTQFKAFCGTELVLETIAKAQKRVNPTLKVAGFVPTMFDKRNSQDVRTLEAVEQQLSPIAPVFPALPRTTAFANAAEEHQPLAVHNPKNPAVRILEEMAQRILKESA